MGTAEEAGNFTISWNISSSILAEKTENDEAKACQLYKFIWTCILMGMLCLAGIIGNILSFIVFWKDVIKTSTSFLFQALSFIDTCLLVTCFPLYVVISFVDYTRWWPEYYNVHSVVLVFVYPLAMLSQTTTIWVTVLVGINRYIAVCKPYQASRLCTVPQARKQLFIVIFVVCLYSLPKFFEAKLDYSTNENNVTSLEPNYTALGSSKWYKIIYNNIFYMIFMLILPLIILTILNIRLINALKEIRRRRAEMQSLRQQQDNNVTFVLIIVVLVFTICQAPALINQILWNVLTNDSRMCGGFQFYFSPVSNFLVMLNSSVNFVIYFLFNTKFRQVLVQWICKTEYHRIRMSTTNNCRTEVTRTELKTEFVNEKENSHSLEEKENNGKHEHLTPVENHDNGTHEMLENGQTEGLQQTIL